MRLSMLQCDHCGKQWERGTETATRWTAERFGASGAGQRFDFCEAQCLSAWAGKQR